ncbi:MAG: farnesyl diphosphate synthase [Pseudomonadota bacterium]
MASAEWVAATRHHFERALDELLDGIDNKNTILAKKLHEAMCYAMLNGGKRARPLLCYAAGLDFGAPLLVLDRVASAIEAVHVYSLVHDDLPCMDDDILRRGKPTCHIAYDEPTAMLVGDALQSIAFEWLSTGNSKITNAEISLKHISILSRAIGLQGMAGGQQLDLMATDAAGIDLRDLENIHRMKTGALIEASIIMGAIFSPGGLSASDKAALKDFSRALGLAFQVIDDILDATTDTVVLGKTAGKDADQNKATYVRFLGIDEARIYAHRLNEEATQARERCSIATPHLEYLQNWLIQRTF